MSKASSMNGNTLIAIKTRNAILTIVGHLLIKRMRSNTTFIDLSICNYHKNMKKGIIFPLYK